MDGLVARSLEHASESSDNVTAHTSVVHCAPERPVMSLAARAFDRQLEIGKYRDGVRETRDETIYVGWPDGDTSSPSVSSHAQR